MVRRLKLKKAARRAVRDSRAGRDGMAHYLKTGAHRSGPGICAVGDAAFF